MSYQISIPSLSFPSPPLPQARSTKSRARIDRFTALTRLTDEQKQRLKQQAAVDVSLGPSSRLGSKVLEMSDATAERGKRVIFDGFT